SGALVTVELPKASSTVTTNFMNMPLTISSDGSSLDVNIPTNRADLALRFVHFVNQQGEIATETSGSWGQYGFHKLTDSIMYQTDGGLRVGGFNPTKVTF